MTKAGIQLAFSDIACGVGECGGRVFEVDPSGSLEPGDEVTLRVVGATQAMVSGLTLYRGGRTIVQDSPLPVAAAQVTEVLSFEGAEKIQLKYPVKGGTYISCIAQTDIMEVDNTTKILSLNTPAGNIVPLERVGFSCVGVNRNVVLYGTMQVIYSKAQYEASWPWTVPAVGGDYYFYLMQGPVLIYAHKITIDMSDYTVVTPVDVVVIVREYTTDAPVQGASVKINGASAGTTDSNGRINIGRRSIGRYTIKITKAGYVDSDLDDLENDSFIVGKG